MKELNTDAYDNFRDKVKITYRQRLDRAIATMDMLGGNLRAARAMGDFQAVDLYVLAISLVDVECMRAREMLNTLETA